MEILFAGHGDPISSAFFVAHDGVAISGSAATWFLNLARTPVRPENIHHYTSADGLKGIATSASAAESAAQYLNDGKEIKLTLGIAKQLLEREADQNANTALGSLLAYYSEEVEWLKFDRVGVSSLSEEPDLSSQ